MPLTRREFVAGSVAAALPVPALPLPALAQSAGARTLKFVPSVNLVSLDPVFSTALGVIQHGYYVFDTLYGVDGALRPHPQMAEGHEVSADGRAWTIKLRPGLLFHDGTPVRSVDCIASLKRWSARDTFGIAMAAAVDGYDAVDDATFRIRLKRPFPRLLDAIGKPHSSPAFVMPERLAQTDPNTPVTEMVGSGPFRFVADQFSSGNRVVYQRFDRYVPRGEPAEWTSGGKVAHFDRVEWHIIPDSSTAVGALKRGEVDWLEEVSADLVPLVSSDKNVTLAVSDALGTIPLVRFNSLTAPFDRKEVRRFVARAIDQVDVLSAVTNSDEAAYRVCRSMFPCTIAGVEQDGGGVFGALAGSDGAAAALKAAGYGGEKVVVINPSDQPVLAAIGNITAEILRQAGMNVDLQSMDWGTMLQRRTSKAPSDKGGWSLFPTTWPSIAIANPVLNLTVKGDGAAGYAGWFDDADMRGLTADWLAADEPGQQKHLFDAVQARALDEMPSLPLGVTYPKTGYRADLQGVLQGSVRYPWNVKRA